MNTCNKCKNNKVCEIFTYDEKEYPFCHECIELIESCGRCIQDFIDNRSEIQEMKDFCTAREKRKRRKKKIL